MLQVVWDHFGKIWQNFGINQLQNNHNFLLHLVKMLN